MRRVTLACILLTAAMASGCNRADVVKVPGDDVRLDTADFRIAPQRVQVAPGRITFTMRNTGSTPHNLVVQRRGRVFGRVATLMPGATGTGEMTLRRGTYRMFCSIARHEVLGEYGSVSVR